MILFRSHRSSEQKERKKAEPPGKKKKEVKLEKVKNHKEFNNFGVLSGKRKEMIPNTMDEMTKGKELVFKSLCFLLVWGSENGSGVLAESKS